MTSGCFVDSKLKPYQSSRGYNELHTNRVNVISSILRAVHTLEYILIIDCRNKDPDSVYRMQSKYFRIDEMKIKRTNDTTFKFQRKPISMINTEEPEEKPK